MKISILLLASLMVSPNLMAMDDWDEQLLLRMSLSDSLIGPTSEQWTEARIKLDEYYNRYEQCLLSKVMDVHQFNAKMKWSEVLPVLTKIDTELFGSDDGLSYGVVEEKIKSSSQYQMMIEKDQKNFDQEFLKLSTHLSKNVVEGAETRTDVQKLLSRIWCLSDKFGFLSDSYMINDRESAIDFLMTSIKTNIFEGGGCYPGYAGRLALNYLMILHARVSGLDSEIY